jgi:hypothetical protein
MRARQRGERADAGEHDATLDPPSGLILLIHVSALIADTAASFDSGPQLWRRLRCKLLGVSVHLVGTAAFKAVEGLYTQSLVGSIPIRSRPSSSSSIAFVRRANYVSPFHGPGGLYEDGRQA